jgi:signal transduction histidine kinase
MKTWLRGKSGGLCTFLIVAGLVVGGLGWVTAATLRLEEEQGEARAQAEHSERLRLWQHEQEERQTRAQSEFAGRLHLALWRLDSRIAPILAREDTRPYHHYSALFAPSVVLEAGNRREPAVVLEPSPLVNATLPDWMLLHFQTAPSAGWGSPQVLPAGYLKLFQRNDISLTNVTSSRKELLAEITYPETSKTLLNQVQQQELQLDASFDVPLPIDQQAGLILAQGNEKNPTFPQNSMQQANANVKNFAPPVPQAPPGQFDYWNRIQQRIHTAQESKLGPWNDAVDVVTANTADLKKWWSSVGQDLPRSRGQLLVSLSPMTPLWLKTGQKERLIVARMVRISSPWPDQMTILSLWPSPGLPVNLALAGLADPSAHKLPGPREACQGIVLDWPKLQTLLTAEVSNIFPQAHVLPMRDEVPPHPERTMTALPVELDPGETPSVEPGPPAPEAPEVFSLGWTPLRIGLVLAWAAALVALLAVGLGGWSLLDLSERRIRFVSAVTHELRTPLTTLRLYLDMLMGGLVRSEEQKATYLETLNAETERLNRLVSNVLDFSRLENQRPRLERKSVLLAELLEQLRATWRTRCQDVEKELLIENALAEDFCLVTDEQLVQQILGNLIDNACKYSRGAADRGLWVRARREKESHLILEVEDRGPGIPASERRSIFHPFRRGGNADVTAGGVGLGLALAQRWTRLLGGALSVGSGRDGQGACFRLELSLGTR